MKELINRNFKYFNKEILPYYIIIYTSLGQIIIDTKKNNLKHLLGVNKSNQTKFRNMPAEFLYDYLENNSLSLFELIDEGRYNLNVLFQEEKHILYRNLVFKQIFESLFNNVNLSFYYKKSGDLFDADYVQFCYIDMAGGYLGIIGSDTNNCHYFNSIMYEKDYPDKYKGARLIVYKVEKVAKSDFQYNNYKIVKSKRLIHVQRQNKICKIKHSQKSMLTNKDRHAINLLLKNNLKIEKGEYGKKSIKILKDDTVIEKGIKLDLKILDTHQKIARYINENYK